MINDCPHNWENMSEVSLTEHDVLSTAVSNTSEHGVLFTGFQRKDVSRMCRDAQNIAVLDIACSSTVCGQTWFNNYLESLTRDQREKITWKDSKKVLKFGGGTCLTSKGEYSIPAVLAERNVIIQTDIVESDIPLLLSRESMKRASVKLDLENDKAVIFGKEVALNQRTAGHYCVPTDRTDTIPVAEVSTVQENGKEHLTKEKLLKLHRQFAQPPKKRLIALLRDANE